MGDESKKWGKPLKRIYSFAS